MAFRIRKKVKSSQNSIRGKDRGRRRTRTQQEERERLAEWDAIAEASTKHRRAESTFDSFEEEN